MDYGTFVATQLLLGTPEEEALASIPEEKRAEVARLLALSDPNRKARAQALALKAAIVTQELDALDLAGNASTGGGRAR